MSTKANPTVVGSFVAGAILISIIGIMLLGGRSLLEDRFECILYFDESLSGLDAGAPVDFQGVRIGTVTSVRLEFDPEREGEILRPVTLEIEESRIDLAEGRKRAGNTAEMMEALVTRLGLRARLATQSILTGKLKIELGYFPEQPIDRRNGNDPRWEMPTIRSPLKQMASEVAQLPLGDIVTELHRAVKSIADMMDPAVAGQTITALNQTLLRLEGVLTRLESRIDPLTEQTSEIMQATRRSLDEMHAMLLQINAGIGPLLKASTETSVNLNAWLDPDSEMHGEFSRLVEDLQQTSKSIRLLAEFIEQHPETLLHGKKNMRP